MRKRPCSLLAGVLLLVFALGFHADAGAQTYDWRQFMPDNRQKERALNRIGRIAASLRAQEERERPEREARLSLRWVLLTAFNACDEDERCDIRAMLSDLAIVAHENGLDEDAEFYFRQYRLRQPE